MKTARLIIDSPYKNSDLIYAADYYCLDPFIYLEIDNYKTGWLPSTELEKAKKNSCLNQVINLTQELTNLKKQNKIPILRSSLIIDYLKDKKITDILIPNNFPILEANNLSSLGFNIIPQEEPFYKSRAVKSITEIDFIRSNSLKNVEVMKEVKNIILESSVTNDKKLKYNNEILTSEYLQTFILKSLLDKEMISDSVIVSLGDQGCYPHEYGYGTVYANQSIIVDIYPRSRKNYYFTDMTRTFCKGKASSELKDLYKTVNDAQKFVLDKIGKKNNGKDIHNFVISYFENKGYKSGSINGVLQGFFHGTGHGLGLDCHEAPYINSNGDDLPDNSIVSDEPGLYYLGIGGVRIEDLILVTKNGYENLTNFEYSLELE